ncbi:MAG: HAD family phosphatase [Spirochaetota bacterium]
MINPDTLKSVIFDVDGVLFNTEPLHRQAWILTMADFGYTVSEESLIPWTGIPCYRLADHYSSTLKPFRPPELYSSIKQTKLHALLEKELEVFSGVEEMLVRLKGSVPLGYATSLIRADIEVMFTVSGLGRYFSAGAVYEDVKNHKPDPEVYLMVAEKLKMPPSLCAAIDDSPSGIKAARTAGMLTLGVTNSFPAAELKEADLVFESTPAACRWLLAASREL